MKHCSGRNSQAPGNQIKDHGVRRGTHTQKKNCSKNLGKESQGGFLVESSGSIPQKDGGLGQEDCR